MKLSIIRLFNSSNVTEMSICNIVQVVLKSNFFRFFQIREMCSLYSGLNRILTEMFFFSTLDLKMPKQIENGINVPKQ